MFVIQFLENSIFPSFSFNQTFLFYFFVIYPGVSSPFRRTVLLLILLIFKNKKIRLTKIKIICLRRILTLESFFLKTTGDVKDVTLFRGARKPCQKECLLIYDHDTGEFTLEELSSNIQLKQVRYAKNKQMFNK